MIDSLNGYLNAMPEERFLLAQLHELFTFLRQRGVLDHLGRCAARAGRRDAGADRRQLPRRQLIERRHPHEDAGLQRDVIPAVGVQSTRHLERPVPGGPAGSASNVRPIAGESRPSQ